jgi:hypothetical protein
MPIRIDYQRIVSQSSLQRRAGGRGRPKDTFLIVCEGEETEPNYFKAFRLSSARVWVHGLGFNTDSLVEEVIKEKKKAANSGMKFDQIWCVLDKDSFPSQNLNRALQLAKNNNIRVAYSNQSFELWYLLHFDYLDAALSRTRYIEKLTAYLGKRYQKNSNEMYKIILGKQAAAIRNAEKLLSNYHPPNPDQNDPSTTVHKLVIELNKFL